VALLGLDAADREHRLPSDVHQVGAERERDHRVVGQPELARADEHHSLLQATLGELAVHPAEAEPERQRHRVGEYQWGRPGATLTAVDVDEVHPARRPGHQLGQLCPERHVPDRRLDHHR
jgi:hypothetical protein